MGGAYNLTPYGKGNQTPLAEFNIWQDPEAASIVFGSGADIFAVGLDVSTTPTACLDSRYLEQLKSGCTPAARLAASLVKYAVRRHGRCELHDPLALATLLDISLFDFVSAPVEVIAGNGWDRGITRVLPPERASETPSVHIAAAVDGPRFLSLFLSRILED